MSKNTKLQSCNCKWKKTVAHYLLYAFVQNWSQNYICINWFRLIIADNFFVLFFYQATLDLIYIQFSNINMVKLLSQISCPTKQYPEKYSIPMCYRLSDYPGCELCLSLLSSQRHHLNGFKAQNLIYAYQQIFCQWLKRAHDESSYKHCQRHNGPEDWVHLDKVTFEVISRVQTQILITFHHQNLD